MSIDLEELRVFLKFRTSRSSGPGGQSVNKTETRVEAMLNLSEVTLFNDEEKNRIREKLGNRINASDEIVVAASDQRSQLANKELATERLRDLLEDALKVRKPRKKSRPSKQAVEKRLKAKSERSEVKQGRRWKL